ncbi:MAG: hypothetical protein H7Z20_04265 [Bdellovibrio sp.]|nr:hypothetical protein [Methylotenera sp.]
MHKRPFLFSLAMIVLVSACATAPKAANADTAPASEAAAPQAASESNKTSEVIKISTNGKYSFYVNDVENPELTLKRGKTYQIEVDTPGHPLWIKSKDSVTTDNAYSDGVTNNGTYKGTVTFAVPADAPATLFYNCQYHLMMHGKVNIID